MAVSGVDEVARSGWKSCFEVMASWGREERVARYRRWLWEEIQKGRVDLAELAGLHGKLAAGRPEWEGEVLEAAAMWALTEQARRLAALVAGMTRG